MEFFETQEVARRKTGLLLLLFALAVLATTVLVYLVLVAVWTTQSGQLGELGAQSLFNPYLLLGAGGGTVGLVGIGSAYRIAQLRSAGGEQIAASLGGRLVPTGTASPANRRLLNVVEEMAIASGTAVPTVFLLDGEPAINAFAAGYSPDGAVIGVTRGCVERLSRDELQGVVAHEFSHILNGDMRMNIRLIGWLHGLLVIGMTGAMLLRGGAYAGGHRRRGGGGGQGAIIAVGVGLLVVGYVGMFFAKIIKAAVSRQREYLADAAAVQFTRNPGGLAGALKKIGAPSVGARLRAARAEEASHMFFGQGITVHLNTLFATHPPLPARIRRLDPNWDGTFPELPRDVAARPSPPEEEDEFRPWEDTLMQAAAAGRAAAPARTAVDDIGRLDHEHIAYAAALIDALPPPVRRAAESPFAARALIGAMLLDADPEVRAAQHAALRDIDAKLAAAVGELEGPVGAIAGAARLSVVELAMPALRELSPGQYRELVRSVDALVRADHRIALFEWMIQRVLKHALEPIYTGVPTAPTRYDSLSGVGEACRVLLTVLARAGHRDVAAAEAAYRAGADRLDLPRTAMLGPERATLGELDRALDELAMLAPRHQRAVLDAAAATVAADRQVTEVEGQLIRAIAATLDCPMPPLLPGQRLV